MSAPPRRAKGSGSNRSAGRRMPSSASLSLNVGRMPVDLRRPLNLRVLVHPHREVEFEEVLHRDDVSLHPFDLGDVGDATCSVPETRDLDDQVDSRCDLLTNGPHRKVVTGHQDQRFET